ncbi:MAG: FAD-binding oxidoreductase [Acidobacteria bacterium]|jgi:glycolate oxidase|nr:FAD-binding oxidoreductase [Acidobacteriota bacterium]MDP7338774.1 FAD-linked oxidase C-terminal domain-containing protein [Vicinamibacterales bacterium]MDP7478593.1 FAD-linked oxidase C-terminal domain-containing protein [Vicinamibacterales bacterium]MDP7690229.1 FAD-linked oxidase C-terminal domain-containing protein [Vicinamibacterales bacterium]HJN45652.1 FAD-linked oxidase C-terminal domain-containing protein [Vicinamibacterales bacterium]
MEEIFLAELERIVGPEGLVRDASDLLTYESDGLVRLRERPAAAVLPDSVEQVQAVVRLCHRSTVPFVARGQGTGLSGGALPHPDGVLIVMTRMNRILDVDIPNQRMTVEPGVMNLDVTREVESAGYYYAPDPSSQLICSIGGNVAENSGGAHCLKYGFTVHHVVGVEAVLPDGELVHLGGEALDSPGLDLLGVLVGSEGTLAVVTKVTLRLVRQPEAVRTLLAAFDSTDAAGNAVSDIISAGIIPAAIEMMDRTTIRAAEAAVHPGFPDAEAVLIVELDGSRSEVEALFSQVEAVCAHNEGWGVQVARDEAHRGRIWMGRKAAFAAMGRIAPSYYVQDGVIPRSKLPEVLRRIRQLEVESGLTIGNVFHAGDGNLHPLVCYDDAVDGQAELAEQVASKILTYCLDVGGSLTGEHGVGADKACHMPKMFSAEDLETMQLVRVAFDPDQLCNPGKVFPTPRLCGEVPGPYRAHPAEIAGLAERF